VQLILGYPAPRPYPSAERLVGANLRDPKARHLLLIAEGPADGALDLVRAQAQAIGRPFLLLVGSVGATARTPLTPAPLVFSN